MSFLKSELELLRRVPLLCGIDPARLKLLAYMSDVVTIGSGEPLFHEGDRSDAAYVVIEGNVDVSVDTPSGTVTLAHLGPGDFLGEIGILCEVPRTATVTATSDMRALRIRQEPFFELLKQFPDVAVELLRGLAERLSRTSGELVEAQRKLAVEAAHA